jgi:hypothetical protein
VKLCANCGTIGAVKHHAMKRYGGTETQIHAFLTGHDKAPATLRLRTEHHKLKSKLVDPEVGLDAVKGNNLPLQEIEPPAPVV